jgi:hypothetical protein
MVLIGGDKLIAETTLTREQAALKAWCDKRNVFVDFTGDKIAIVYLRMAGRWRIGAIEYILRGNSVVWCAHATECIGWM